MRRLLFFATLILFGSGLQAHAYVSVACGRTATDPIVCVLAQTGRTEAEASQSQTDAVTKCQQSGILDCRWYGGYGGACHGIAATPDGRVAENYFYDVANVEKARISAFRNCNAKYQVDSCRGVIAFCDVPTGAASTSSQTPAAEPRTTVSTSASPPATVINWVAPNVTTIAVSLVTVLLIILLYAARAPILNFIIHHNLPNKLETYGDDIRCVFKRTQRVNWYGRVVFGIVVTLVMTKDQLADVRKYWLGRVIAFDSLRRQRQNELAKMHLQLAKSVKSEAKDTKPLYQLLAALKFLFFVIFYLIRALFSFLFGFLFIRVTIARLVRGTVIESKDLTLVLQAKEAIEQSATYLKEYLETANTFDGRGEVV